MAYFRRPKNHEHPYAQIANSVLEDKDLSFKAKGILSYLLSRSDEWEVYQAQLADLGPDGETAVRSGIKELMKAGYLERSPRRNDDGTIAKWEYIVYESPIDGDASRTGSSHTGSHNTGESKPTNTEEQQNGINQDGSPRAREGKGGMEDGEEENLHREDDPPGITAWIESTGERPSLGTKQTLRQMFTGESSPDYHHEVFRKTVKEAYLNVDGKAHRIGLGYRLSAYERKLSSRVQSTDDGKRKGHPEPGAEYNPRGYRIQ
jgi:hypothetical protein